jgi:hypothetical protein
MAPHEARPESWPPNCASQADAAIFCPIHSCRCVLFDWSGTTAVAREGREARRGRCRLILRSFNSHCQNSARAAASIPARHRGVLHATVVADACSA